MLAGTVGIELYSAYARVGASDRGALPWLAQAREAQLVGGGPGVGGREDGGEAPAALAHRRQVERPEPGTQNWRPDPNRGRVRP
ncbi:hypothetical protein ACFWMJ_03820, partial [Streptomyces hawaiiensis]|uniref:hypothetical protein n=1 Tax=Streptomyces hawaiiensis TaxID=67305 RepID=UPI003647AC78